MKNYREIEEMSLLALVKKGEQSAFSEIVRRNEQSIASVVYSMLENNDEAEDVGQEVFISFYRNIEKFRGDSKLSTYLTKIAINLSLNALKKRKTQLAKGVHVSNDSVIIKDRTDKQSQYETKELVDRAIQNLEIEFRSVVVLRLIEGYSTKEVAKILDLPLGTVLSRLSRGQKKLKLILTPLMN